MNFILFEKFKTGVSNFIKKLNLVITHPITSIILNFIILIIAFIALKIAVDTFENSNKQFEQNSKSSDSLFNVQLKNAKELNDSLISQIKSLQDVTKKQLGITDQQLKISTETYQEQLYSNRPKLVVLYVGISDTNIYIDNKFSPILLVKYQNVGKRNALNTEIRNFVVFNDLSGFRTNIGFLKTSLIEEPESVSTSDFKPKIPYSSKDQFYYCFELNYYDEGLKRQFRQTYYYEYKQVRGTFDFWKCDDDTKAKLKGVLNEWLDEANVTLFDN